MNVGNIFYLQYKTVTGNLLSLLLKDAIYRRERYIINSNLRQRARYGE